MRCFLFFLSRGAVLSRGGREQKESKQASKQERERERERLPSEHAAVAHGEAVATGTATRRWSNCRIARATTQIHAQCRRGRCGRHVPRCKRRHIQSARRPACVSASASATQRRTARAGLRGRGACRDPPVFGRPVHTSQLPMPAADSVRSVWLVAEMCGHVTLAAAARATVENTPPLEHSTAASPA